MDRKQRRLLVVDNRPELKFAVQFAQTQTFGYQLGMASSLEEARQQLKSSEYFGVLTTLLSPTQELPQLIVEVLRSGCRRIVIAVPHDEGLTGADDEAWSQCKKELTHQGLRRLARKEALIKRVGAYLQGECHWSPREQRICRVDYRPIERDSRGIATKMAYVPVVKGDILPDDHSSFTSWFGVMMDAADLFPGTPHDGDLELWEAAQAQY